MVEHNGLADRIRIVGKPVSELSVPEDLPRRADLLLFDLFADLLFNFRPFDAVRAARRLLQPDAIFVPRRVSLVAALADFREWPRLVPGEMAGFDLSPLSDIASMRLSLDPADPDLSLRSLPESLVDAALPNDLPAREGTSERMLASDGGLVNGVALWLRLELAPGHVLEARPGVAPRGYYGRPYYFAFLKSLDTRSGEPCPIRLEWGRKGVHVRLIPI
jgi:type II protein arginine methyltransferase